MESKKSLEPQASKNMGIRRACPGAGAESNKITIVTDTYVVLDGLGWSSHHITEMEALDHPEGAS